MTAPTEVRELAQRGHSMTDAAAILGVHREEFIEQCRANGWDAIFPAPLDALARRATIEARRGQPLGSPRRITYQGVTDTLTGHARRLGLAWSTVHCRYRRHPEDLDYVFAQRRHRG